MSRVLLAPLALGLFPATAAAGPVISVPGAPGPGPSRYDREPAPKDWWYPYGGGAPPHG